MTRMETAFPSPVFFSHSDRRERCGELASTAVLIGVHEADSLPLLAVLVADLQIEARDECLSCLPEIRFDRSLARCSKCFPALALTCSTLSGAQAQSAEGVLSWWSPAGPLGYFPTAEAACRAQWTYWPPQPLHRRPASGGQLDDPQLQLDEFSISVPVGNGRRGLYLRHDPAELRRVCIAAAIHP